MAFDPLDTDEFYRTLVENAAEGMLTIDTDSEIVYANPAVEEILGYAAGGFRDFTRIASSDPVMWRDICLGNRDAVLEALGHFRRDLEQLTEKVEAADAAGLEGVFRRAKATRDAHKHGFER